MDARIASSNIVEIMAEQTRCNQMKREKRRAGEIMLIQHLLDTLLCSRCEGGEVYYGGRVGWERERAERHETHTQRERERERERYTHSHTQRETDTHTHSHTHTTYH